MPLLEYRALNMQAPTQQQPVVRTGGAPQPRIYLPPRIHQAEGTYKLQIRFGGSIELIPAPPRIEELELLDIL